MMSTDTLVPTTALLKTPLRKYILIVALSLILLTLFGTSMASQILIFSIFALGYNLLFGYGGELSFGHAAFYGVGVYGTILAAQVVPNLYVAMLVGIVVSTIIGAAFSWISLRQRGIYFAMITLGLAQMVYFIALQWTDVTGGFNGLTLTSSQSSLLQPGSPNLIFYVVCVGVLLLVLASIQKLLHSPYGMILISVRENERKASSLGYNPDRVLLVAATISAFISGIAGALHAVLFAYVNPNVLFWTQSGEIVLATLIGGFGTLMGPIVGAIIFELISNYLSEFFSVWELVFGIVIVLTVIFAPEGIYGYILKMRDPDNSSSRFLRIVIDKLLR